MSYKSLKDCCEDLERNGFLVRLQESLDPKLIIPEIHRRVYEAQGPALLFENVIGSKFQAVSNVFATSLQSEFIFRHELKKLEWLFRAKADPVSAIKSPLKSLGNIPFLGSALPKKTYHNQLKHFCKISDLPQIVSWPKDGGSFITLPQVISFPPNSRDPKQANVGMYRIQLTGNNYITDQEVGLHYQIHRGIGIHHLQHNDQKVPFHLSIGVGGPPAYTLASIFPLPEGLSEILFSGLLNNRRYRYTIQGDYFIPQDVDFCITGTVNTKRLKPEGPFGDHLGYYSLAHDFPFLENIKVYHKKDAIWHFTVVGRPPQEDTSFGHLIHQMVASITTTEFPGIKQIHAVDAAGVHPLLLAVGSERYMPFRDRKPEEILTMANHLLGRGQTSLAKYLIIAAEENHNPLDTHDIKRFLNYVLERIDWRYDLHFYTQTTIDTLDYSGQGWNSGSKLVIACNRDKKRELDSDLTKFSSLPDSFSNVRLIQKGIVAIQCKAFGSYDMVSSEINAIKEYLSDKKFEQFPLVVLCDDSPFISTNYSNFIWVTFTRSNPSHDIYGVHERVEHKHWSCGHTLIIDARSKPHHAPPLEVDSDTKQKVDDIIFRNPVLKKILK
jgi:4-hydroxy-3-polyprenylbenzoate decarboxylase